MKINLAIFCAFALFSCKKDESTPSTQLPCELENFGTIELANSQVDPIDIWINGAYWGRLGSGQRSQPFNRTAGNYRFQAEQASGYVLYPDVWDSTHKVESCKRTTLNY
jgi:hypothetical protein